MEIKETVQKLLQEMVVPDLSRIRDENSKILAILDVTNKRLDDMNTHLADQSRRIDDVRSELGQRIDETNKRIDETNKRIDALHSDLIDRLDANNARIDRFFLESVSKDEHHKFDERVSRLEREVETIRRQIAA
ncbi:MAG: hypothetical protein KAU38_11715 [Desulfobacterales bacterium]|nr:hypothetical protein [Desulfobacterales bacterium]